MRRPRKKQNGDDHYLRSYVKNIRRLRNNTKVNTICFTKKKVILTLFWVISWVKLFSDRRYFLILLARAKKISKRNKIMRE